MLNQAVHLPFVRGFSSVEERKDTVMCITWKFFPRLHYFFLIKIILFIYFIFGCAESSLLCGLFSGYKHGLLSN